MRIVPVVVSLALVAALVGVGPGGRAAVVLAQQPAGGSAPAPLVERARQDLARRLGISSLQVTVAAESAMTWTSAALGCPAPGMGYAAVQTPGFRLTLEAFGQRHDYHTDTRETFVLCGADGQAVAESQVLGASGLIAALLERGVRVEAADAYAELPFLRADGTRYRLSGGGLPDGTELQVYDYHDLEVASADVGQIGPDGQPKSGRVEWARPPHIFRSGGVVALTFDGAQAIVDLLTDLLGSPLTGAAAPGSPPPGSPPPAGMPPSSMPPTDPAVPRVTWDEAKALITGGKVQQAFQTHALEVRLYLKDGTSVATTETRIDEVFQVIRDCGAPCADIMIATE
jgi:hypothetical protein